jgi:putative hemolysin
MYHNSVLDTDAIESTLPNSTAKLINKVLIKLPPLRTIQHWHSHCQELGDVKAYLDKYLSVMGVSAEIDTAALQQLNHSGPTVVVANHPFGCLEGMLLGKHLLEIRQDTKIMVNYWLEYFAGVKDLFIGVDPFENNKSFNHNGLKDCLRVLKNQGVLVTFPSGEVAHFRRTNKTILESPWSPTIARLIHHAKANVLPIYIEGRNSLLFHIAGLIHPRLRTLLLLRELTNKKNKAIHIRVGDLIPYDNIKEKKSASFLIGCLRTQCELLKNRVVPVNTQKQQPIVVPTLQRKIVKNIKSLKAEDLMFSVNQYDVFLSPAQHIPDILYEIGRLREISFREHGTGTGRATDLDQFDEYYRHLFIWDRQEQLIVGSYRLGVCADILPQHGASGLYISSAYRMQPEFLKYISNGVEMGRSFVREEYQQQALPLNLLWRGICTFCGKNPHLRKLLGQVSLAQNYPHLLADIIVDYLRQHHYISDVAQYIECYHPYQIQHATDPEFQSIIDANLSAKDFDRLIKEISHQQYPMPVLFKHYLNMNTKALAFSIDPEFSHCIDCLMLVDMDKVNRRMMKRFMGAELFESYYANQPTIQH